MASTTDRLMSLAAKRFKRDASKLSAEQDIFQALEIDSVQALDLLSELEDEFEVEIPDYELQGVNTFAGLAALIEKRL